MPLPASISDDQKALTCIVAGLFAMLGLAGAVGPQRIGRSLYRAVGLVLRPAESAVRRLIYFVSLSISVKPAAVRPMPSDIVRTGGGKSSPRFALFDPRLHLVRRAKSHAQTLRPQPRISFFGDGEVRMIDLARTPRRDAENDGMIDAAALLRRLEAIKSALGDLPRQARRLKRALQRRQRSPRLKMQGVLRPGYPPGHRARRIHQIDDVLRRCHVRAREALPDTS
jgi:hypothetical protein